MKGLTTFALVLFTMGCAHHPPAASDIACPAETTDRLADREDGIWHECSDSDTGLKRAEWKQAVDGAVVWRVFRPTGELQLEALYDGSAATRMREWHKNGIMAEDWNVTSEEEDNVQHWYENGQLRDRLTHRDGELHGRWMQWYPDGSPRKETNWDKGVLHGPYKFWHDEGGLKASGQYLHGEAVGTWDHWSEDGVRVDGESCSPAARE